MFYHLLTMSSLRPSLPTTICHSQKEFSEITFLFLLLDLIVAINEERDGDLDNVTSDNPSQFQYKQVSFSMFVSFIYFSYFS